MKETGLDVAGRAPWQGPPRPQDLRAGLPTGPRPSRGCAHLGLGPTRPSLRPCLGRGRTCGMCRTVGLVETGRVQATFAGGHLHHLPPHGEEPLPEAPVSGTSPKLLYRAELERKRRGAGEAGRPPLPAAWPPALPWEGRALCAEPRLRIVESDPPAAEAASCSFSFKGNFLLRKHPPFTRAEQTVDPPVAPFGVIGHPHFASLVSRNPRRGPLLPRSISRSDVSNTTHLYEEAGRLT